MTVVPEAAGAEFDSHSDAARSLILRESLKMRCQQTGPSAALVFFSMCFVFATLTHEFSAIHALLWLAPIILGMGARVAITRSVQVKLDAMPYQDLKDADLKLLLSSILNQTIVGSGIWSLGTFGSEETQLFITIIITIWAVGIMVNLSSDYRTFCISLPFLLVQPLMYWVTHGVTGLPIAAALVILGPLMVLVVKQSSKTFAESVTIRFEKDALLDKVQAAHESTERALAAAEEANRSKIAFLAAASHDLRQPLFAISVLAETLLMYELPKAGKTVLNKQLQAIGILRSLFDNLLDHSKFEAGSVQAVCRPVLLTETLEPLSAEFFSLCEAKNLQWTFSCQELSVISDPELLGRLLGNLLANAVRYTDQGQVSLHAAAEGAQVRICVADTGPGIAPSNHEKIFQAFVQLANPHRDREHGVGLGLAIVRRIDALLGTRLAMESTLGLGTKFTLWVPLAESPASGTAKPAPAWAGDRLPATLRVWLVEDDPLVRSALTLQFDAWGCHFQAVGSKNELLELRAAENQWPDAVILDDMLGPEDNGLNIAQWLETKMPSAHILIVTGNVATERTATLQASGFTFMRKPLAGDELRHWLQSVAPKKYQVS